MTTHLGTCRLCHREAKLQESHIIPEFFFGLTYDDKHRFRYTPSPTSGRRPRITQQGMREHLLCGNCEAKLSVFEGHAKRVLFDPKGFRRVRHPKGMITYGVNYTRFKLFLLSLLWRASVSSLETFQLVKLGPHEETLRKMVLEEVPGGRFTYPTEFIICSDVPDELRRNIAPPMPFKIKTHRLYMFMFGNLFCNFFVTRNYAAAGSLSFLTEEGELPIHEDPFGLYEAWLADYVSFVRGLSREPPVSTATGLYKFKSL